MNNAPPSLDDLISRHFDEALCPEDHQRLTNALDSDIQSRLDFAAAARLHAGLEALASPLPAVQKRHFARWIMAGAAAVLVIGGGTLSWNQPLRDRIRITLQDMDAGSDGKPEKAVPPGLIKRIVKSPAALMTTGMEAVDVQNLLERYFVNVSPHGLTVPQALVQLEEAIKFENVLKRPELDQLSYSALNPVDPMAADPIVVTPQKTPLSVRNYLDSCKLFRYVLQNPGSFIDTRPDVYVLSAATTWQTEIREIKTEIREIKVSADFLTLGNFKPPYPEGNAAAAVLARSFGVLLSGDESATFSSNPPTATVSALPGKLDQLQRRLDQYAKNAFPQQIAVETRYLKLARAALPAGFEEQSGQVMTNESYSQFLAALMKDKTAVTIQVPSIIVRAGQQANVEIVRKISSTKTKADRVGFSQDTTATLCGELIRVDGLVKLGVLNGLALPGGFDKLGLLAKDASVPQYFNTGYEVWLPPHSTGLFVVESPQAEGFVTLVCLSANLIDPGGQPADTDSTASKPISDLPSGRPIGGKPGFVTSPWAPDWGAVDVREISSGAKVKCPFTGKPFLVP